MKQINSVRDWLFRQMHTRNLVYNTCWEDPRCDRQLLDLQPDSEMVMITSAGCNALDYLLDNPRQINCVDMNPRQNALLELKQVVFKNSDFDQLFQLFGAGRHRHAEELYQDTLRVNLSDSSRQYWDDNMDFFNGRGIRKSFYHYSTSGTFAWMANQYLRVRRNVYDQIQQLFSAISLEEQKRLYYQVESKVLNPLTEFFINRHLTLCLVGVPRSQQQLFVEKYEKGAMGFIQECLRKVFTELPIHDNYFYRLYLNGSYSRDCCPSYLEEGNFGVLRDRCDHIQTHTNTISGFLEANPNPYSHYVLLDHQDWLAANNRPALEQEWKLILQNSKPGTRILLRSAAHEIDFFPDFVHQHVQFEQEETARTHKEDRVGTYASVYLGIVDEPLSF